MKKKKSDIIRVFRCPMFRVNVHFRTGPKEPIEKFCGKLNMTEYLVGGCWQIEQKNKEGGTTTSFLVWIQDKLNFYHMVHETMHLVKMIFELYGIEFTSTNDEMMAYYQEFWVRKFWHVMSNHIEYKSKAKDHVKDKSKGEKSGRKQKTGTK